MSGIISWLRSKEEVIIVGIVTIIIFSWSLLNYESVLNTYIKDGINQIVLNFSGTLLGLLLTSYAILFGLIPTLSKEALETKALKSVNFRFLFSIILSILITADSFLICFTEGPVKFVLIYLQIALLIGLILIIPLLTLYLYYLFKASKRFN